MTANLTSPVDKLHAACQRATEGDTDPYVKVLGAQYRIVADSHVAVTRERDVLREKGQVAELEPSFIERWEQLKGATQIYDVAVRFVASRGERLFNVLCRQVGDVELLAAEWDHMRQSGIDAAESNNAFFRYNAAQAVLMAGLSAALGVDTHHAYALAVELVDVKAAS